MVFYAGYQVNWNVRQISLNGEHGISLTFDQ